MYVEPGLILSAILGAAAALVLVVFEDLVVTLDALETGRLE